MEKYFFFSFFFFDSLVTLIGTPLHIACLEGHFKVTEKLLSSGADLHVKVEADGAEPLHYASGNPNADVLQIFLGKERAKGRGERGERGWRWREINFFSRVHFSMQSSSTTSSSPP
jgi:hypothetical protein